MTIQKNNVQVYGLICPYTGKMRFVEISKNARAAYQCLLQSAHLFNDNLSNWIISLKRAGVTPGLAILDNGTPNGVKSKRRFENLYNLGKQNNIRAGQSKKEQYVNMENTINEDSQLAQDNTSEYETDSE